MDVDDALPQPRPTELCVARRRGGVWCLDRVCATPPATWTEREMCPLRAARVRGLPE